MFGIGACIGGLVLVILFMTSIVWSIPAGHIGVVSSFGEISDSTMSPGGPYFVKPWKTVQRMNVQVQKDEEPATVPTKNGLAVQVKAVLLFHLDPLKAPGMAREVGDKYTEKVVTPYFRNAVRDICAEYPPEALYTSDRTAVEAAVLSRVQKDLGPRGILVESVMLQDPVLPTVVTDRIQAKVGAEQDAQRMEFVLKQKELEAKAKVVEAEGIAKAQKIIKNDLDHNYLIYLWIEALKESAKHNNATIYIPTGSDGMPFFKVAKPGDK